MHSQLHGNPTHRTDRFRFCTLGCILRRFIHTGRRRRLSQVTCLVSLLSLHTL